MTSAFYSFLVSLLVTVAAGALLIPLLRKLKAGQSIREEGPKWHMSKQGTPTMGGIMFIVGTAVAVLTVGWNALRGGDTSGVFVFLFALAFGAIGFIDDYFKVVKKTNLGLTALQKFLLQMVVAAAFLALLRYTGHLTGKVFLPFFNVEFEVWWGIYLFCALIYVVGFVNAVNLTDGVDGLATGVTIPVAVFFTAVFLLWKGAASTGAVFAAALAGGLLGFLFFNFHPAKVFMGDTGSLFLGGALCGMAFACDAPLLLIPVGLVYLIEMFSVMLQVIYFKVSGGKRLFRMAPIHHHFEMGGWSEKKLFFVFMLITVALCAVTLVFSI